MAATSVKAIATAGPEKALRQIMKQWADCSDRPLCILWDETDLLCGETRASFIRQLWALRRMGIAMVFCGNRDMGEFSPAPQTVAQFGRTEIRSLFRQHTAETGQVFEDGVHELVWSLTRGQPWLVNALAAEACFRNPEGRDRSRPITTGSIQRAKEQLILRRDTHIDQLGDKLGEERVRRVIQPILTSTDFDWSRHLDDIEYAIDLGLLRREKGQARNRQRHL